ASSYDELERAVDDLPVMSSPMFHAVLRQEHLRLINERSAKLEYFFVRYDDLFRILHYRAHNELLVSSTSIKPALREEGQTLFMPSFFAELAKALGSKVPAPEKWGLNPATDKDQIINDVTQAVGKSLALPDYEPSLGSYWSAILVVCAGCKVEWVAIRAYLVD